MEEDLEDDLDAVGTELYGGSGTMTSIKEGRELSYPSSAAGAALGGKAGAGDAAMMGDLHDDDQEEDMATMKRRAQVGGTAVLGWW